MSGLDEAKAAIAREDAARFRATFNRISEEVHRYIVGQDEVVEGVLTALLCHGHALLEGVPGIGKTVLVRTLSSVLDLSFNRIQFTPDMLPADILGSQVLEEDGEGGQRVVFRRGPVVTNLLLADEINRATPKTQSAMLEAMQERQVTVGRESHLLPEPFVVLATQNPIEQEGTYPLPEAQLDRFLFKFKVGYPREEEYAEIVRRTACGADPQVEAVADGEELKWMARTATSVPIPEPVLTYCTRLVMASQPGSAWQTPDTARFVALGASPRGVQGLVMAARVAALREGRMAVACADVQRVALPVLRHRLQLNYEARAEGVDADRILTGILEKTAQVAG